MSEVKEKILDCIREYKELMGIAPSFATLARMTGVKPPTMWAHFHKRYSADFCEIDDYYKRFLKK